MAQPEPDLNTPAGLLNYMSQQLAALHIMAQEVSRSMWSNEPQHQLTDKQRQDKVHSIIGRTPELQSCINLLREKVVPPERTEAEQTEEHLEGWARGHLQHHLIWEHRFNPTEVPYDGELDTIHRLAHRAVTGPLTLANLRTQLFGALHEERATLSGVARALEISHAEAELLYARWRERQGL